MKIINVFTVRVMYKSGTTIDFECTKFDIKIDGSNTEFSWKAYKPKKPILLGISEIAAVWQIGVRKVITFKKD